MSFRRPQDALTVKRNGGKTPPPEETFEEAAYLKMLGEKQKPVSVKLMDGEIVRGWVEYYDKYMIRLTREGAPNLFIFKHEIMYIAEGVLKDTRKRMRVPRAAVQDTAAVVAPAVEEPVEPIAQKEEEQS